MAQQLNQAIDHSLTLFLREDAFPTRQWVGSITNETLLPLEQNGKPVAGKFIASSNNWTYYTSGVSGVTVPAVVSPVVGVRYVDYTNGIVAYSGLQVAAPVVSYSYNVVNVIDGYPTWDFFETAQLPLVAVDFIGFSRSPQQLGGGYWTNRIFNLEVFGNQEAERDQIVQVLHEALMYRFPVLDLTQNQPLDDFNNINLTYNRTTQYLRTARVVDFRSRTLRVPDEHEKTRHRAQVTLEIQTEES